MDTSTFKFPYIKGEPKLMAKLAFLPGKSRYFEFLIDSGADYTLISQVDTFKLGLEYEKIESEEIKVIMANLSSIHAKMAPFILTIEGKEFHIPVFVAKEEVKPLLGRKSIFENFDVIFQEREQLVVFKLN